MRQRVLPILCFALFAAGCGGGGGGSSPPVPASTVPSPQPSALATLPPTASTAFVPASGTVTLLNQNTGSSFGSTILPSSNDGTFIVQSPETPAESLTGTFTLPEYTVSGTETAGQSTAAVRRAPQALVRSTDGPNAARPRLDVGSMLSPTRLALRRRPLSVGPNGGRVPQAVRRTQAALGDAFTFSIDQFAITGSSSTCATPHAGFQCYVDVPSHLLAISNHAYVWEADNIAASSMLTSADLATTASQFDADYSVETTAFGPAFFGSAPTNSFQQCDTSGKPLAQSAYQPVPDLSGTVDAHIDIVITNALASQGEGGYFSSGNLFNGPELECSSPGNIEKTNARPMFVAGADFYSSPSGGTPTTDRNYWLTQDMPRTLAHEFQHYLHAIDKYIAPSLSGGTGVFDDAFIDEGCSMLAEDLTLPGAVQSEDSRLLSFYFLYQAGNYSLTSFSGYDQDPLSTSATPPYGFYHNTAGDYGQAYLFMRYLYDRFGVAALHGIYSDRTVLPANSTLANVGPIQAASGESFAQVYREFAAALSASGDPGTTDPRYRFSPSVLLRGTATFHNPGGSTIYAVFNGPRSPEDITSASPSTVPRIKFVAGGSPTAKLIQGATLFFNAQAVAGTGATVRAAVTGAPASSPQAVLVQGAYTDTGACAAPQPTTGTCHP
ncbi:MAG: hypothetical protein NVSMB5_04610 [Candidatus Velthaea sp.]